MFHELLGDLDQLSTSELQKPLADIASGTSSFGPMYEHLDSSLSGGRVG
jgi:hypothetical protein